MENTSNGLDFFTLRQKAGLSLEETAQLIGRHERTVRRYDTREIDGPDAPPRLAVEALLQAVHERYEASLEVERNFRFVDLFAGIGGLRKPFEEIGGQCVFTAEWDRFSQQTYAANFPDSEEHILAGDIRPFAENPDQIPKHDVLVAGFPCQPFSIAGVSKKNSLGRPHGFLCDTQGTLFYDLAKIIRYHEPPVFLLENVCLLYTSPSPRD